MWIQTYSGVKFDPNNCNSADIKLADINHALAMVCRFRGHCSSFYSVAQHSCIVADICQTIGGEYAQEAARWGLFHDAAEAYYGDIPTPFKTEADKLRERDLLDSVAVAIGLPSPYTKEYARAMRIVKRADEIAMATEKRDLMIDDIHWPRLDGVVPLDWSIIALLPQNAKVHFADKYTELFGEV